MDAHRITKLRKRLVWVSVAREEGEAIPLRGGSPRPVPMLKSRGNLFGTGEQAVHNTHRHGHAQGQGTTSSTGAVLVFDCDGASFDLVSGDPEGLPPNMMLPIYEQRSRAVVGVLETGVNLDCIYELTRDVPNTFAKSVRFYARWLKAEDFGVNENQKTITVFVKWAAALTSPRLRTSPRKLTAPAAATPSRSASPQRKAPADDGTASDPITPPSAGSSAALSLTMRVTVTTAYAVAAGT